MSSIVLEYERLRIYKEADPVLLKPEGDPVEVLPSGVAVLDEEAGILRFISRGVNTNIRVGTKNVSENSVVVDLVAGIEGSVLIVPLKLVSGVRYSIGRYALERLKMRAKKPLVALLARVIGFLLFIGGVAVYINGEGDLGAAAAALGIVLLLVGTFMKKRLEFESLGEATSRGAYVHVLVARRRPVRELVGPSGRQVLYEYDKPLLISIFVGDKINHQHVVTFAEKLLALSCTDAVVKHYAQP